MLRVLTSSPPDATYAPIYKNSYSYVWFLSRLSDISVWNELSDTQIAEAAIFK